MKKITKIIIYAILLIILIATIVALSIFKKKAGDKSAVTINPADEVGNIAGNIYAHGLFAEKNGKVYFSNTYAGGNLYSMNADMTDIKKIADGNCSYINVLGEYVYYYTSSADDEEGLGYIREGRGLSRTDINGKYTYPLTSITTDGMLGIGNNIFYNSFHEDEHSDNAILTFDKITTNGETNETLSFEHIYPGSFQNSKLYFSGKNGDHCLYAMDIETNDTSLVSSEWMLYPIVDGDNVYYIDINNGYNLKSLSLTTGEIRTIINERVDFFNYYNGVLVYQNCDPKNGYALKRADRDGNNISVIKEGVYRDINITSTYIYFRDFQNDLPIYLTSTYESGYVTTFDTAFQQALDPDNTSEKDEKEK